MGGIIGATAFTILAWLTARHPLKSRLAWTLAIPALGFLVAPELSLSLVPVLAVAPMVAILHAPGFPIHPRRNSRVQPCLVWALGVAFAGCSILGAHWWLSTKQFFAIELIPGWLPAPLLLPSLIGAALVNAVFEECLWRKLLPVLVGSVRWATPILCVAFGATHYWAIPNGLVGVALTTVFAGLMNGLAFLARGRILPAVVVHAVADAYLLFTLVTLSSPYS